MNDNGYITNILGYADDITLVGKDKDTILKYLSDRIKEVNLAINLQKCKSLSLNFECNMKMEQNKYIIEDQLN